MAYWYYSYTGSIIITSTSLALALAPGPLELEANWLFKLSLALPVALTGRLRLAQNTLPLALTVACSATDSERRGPASASVAREVAGVIMKRHYQWQYY